MSIEEQKAVKAKCHNEAIRYMDNAKDILKKANKNGKYYMDDKYVKIACGTAYSGVLVALDGFFKTKDVPPPKGNKRKSIEYYKGNAAKLDGKLSSHLNNVYNILHLSGYYEGVDKVDIIMSGFEEAYAIIEKIKP